MGVYVKRANAPILIDTHPGFAVQEAWKNGTYSYSPMHMGIELDLS